MPLPADSQGYVLKPGGTGEYATPTTSVGFLLAMILAYFNGTLTSGGQTAGGITVAGNVDGSAGGVPITGTGPNPGPFRILKSLGGDVIVASVTLPTNWGSVTLTNQTISNGDSMIIAGMTAVTLTSGTALAYT